MVIIPLRNEDGLLCWAELEDFGQNVHTALPTLRPFEKFATLIEKHWNGIVPYCEPRNKVNLGFVEGLNNKIRVIQQRAYGYRDEEYMRLKILTAFLPKK
jgi:transposase